MTIASGRAMINDIFSTYSAKSASQRRLDIVANNLSNAATPGFKVSRLVYNGSTLEEPVDPNQLDQMYVNLRDSYVHFSDAPVVETGNPLDVAIEGKGFFAISTRSGTMYTRNGQFIVNSDKKLVTVDGDPVIGESGETISIDGKDVAIESDGSVFADKTLVGKIKVVNFTDLKNLKNFGKSLFVNSGPEPEAATSFSLRQHYIESSNVDVVKEMVEMINATRAYEALTKADQSADETLAKLIDMGKV
jgi:flagellar basal-body rod protein FlgG